MELNATLSTTKPMAHSTTRADKKLPQQLYQYIIYIWLGLIGGAIGTTLAFALAIIIQSMQSPTTVFWPRAIILAPVAAILGWGVSWLLSKLAHRSIPSFVNNKTNERRLQVMLVVSGLLSVIQTYLFIPFFN